MKKQKISSQQMTMEIHAFMKPIFEQIAEDEEAQYSYYEKTFAGVNCSSLPVRHHQLEVPFGKSEIRVHYELGNHNMGTFVFELAPDIHCIDFEITNKSHIWRLFNRKANILDVKCQNISFKLFLQDKLKELGLEDLARKNLFEPKINIQKIHEKSILKAEFYLGFEDKHLVIKPILALFRAIIRYLE